MHSKLLHLPVESPKRPPPRFNDQSKQESVKSSSINSQPNGKINTVKGIEKGYIDERDCSSLVPLMALTAVKRNPESEKVENDIKFYALVDTGADTSICTRELAESLFKWNTRLSFSSWKNSQTRTIACVRLFRLDREMVRLLIYQISPLLKQLFPTKRAFLIRSFSN